MTAHRFSPNPTEKSLYGHILSWLASWDFGGNPFESWEASREPWLGRYFIRRPFFEQLLSTPKSTLVFAPRGGGKSATRIMVEAECRPAVPTSPVLAVSFTDFSPFIESHSQPPRLTLADYLPHLIGTALPQALNAVIGLQLPISEFHPTQIGELRYWLDHYAPYTLGAQYLCNLIRPADPSLDDEMLALLAANIQSENPLPTGLDERATVTVRFLNALRSTQPIAPCSPVASPSQEMRAFVQLALGLLRCGPVPCNMLYLLIDGVDEYTLTQESPDASTEVLCALLGNVHFLEIPELAVKFFLPSEQRSALEHIARVDRLDVITLTWESPQTSDEPDYLRQLLRRRIAAFNTRGLIGLGELCDPAMRRWIDDAMLEEARDSPRNLIRLGDLLFAEHCRDLPDPGSVLLPTEWERALTRFRATVCGEVQVQQTAISPITVAAAPTPSSPGIPCLRVDLRSGRVFRGTEELPPLADLEYRLLAFLYRRKGQICTKDEIALAVYEPKYGQLIREKDSGISDETISRLLYRLRQRIDPPDQDEPVYVKTIKGRGYRLDNAG